MPIETVIFRNIGLRGGVSPVRRYIPELLDDVLEGRVNPGRVFDFATDLNGIVEAYTARIVARSQGAPDDAQRARLTPAWRRWEQAAEALDTAKEAEDFQAVGMGCRECLIQLVRALARPGMVPPGEEPPQRSNAIEWPELIANTMASGASAERIRGHLKATAKSAWELAGWLTHANGANRQDAAFVLNATHAVLAAFGMAAIRYESGSPDRCPPLARAAHD